MVSYITFHLDSKSPYGTLFSIIQLRCLHCGYDQGIKLCYPVYSMLQYLNDLTHWGRVTHICVSKLTIIGSDNGLSPDRRRAIIWTNAGISIIGPLGTNFSEILIEILTFSFEKKRLKVSSVERRRFCLGLNVLTRSNLLEILVYR